MKKSLFTLILMATTILSFSQSPNSFQYQAVVRGSNGDIVANLPVSFRLSIITDTAAGTVVYSETHSVTTNSFGLAVFAVGTGTWVSGSFSGIAWGADTHFLKVEVNITGGVNYEDMGTTQLISVPYALHSKTSEDAFSGNYNDLTNTPDFTGWDQNASNDFNGSYSALTGAPTNLSQFTNDVGYVTTSNDADADPANELQTLSL
jgi:hypothetical protein